MLPVRAFIFLLLGSVAAQAEPAIQRTTVRVEDEAAAKETRRRGLWGPIDQERVFDTNQMSPMRQAPGRFQGAKSAASKEFQFEQKVNPKAYNARTYSGAKGAWMGDMKFVTKNAPTKGKYEIAGASKQAAVKTAPTKDARESKKTAAVREMPGANREYRGPEADKLHKPVKPEELPRITNELKKLETVEDVKALLNKNK